MAAYKPHMPVTINVNELTEDQDYVGQRFGNFFEVAEYGQPVGWIFPIEIAFYLMDDEDIRDREGWDFCLTQEQIDDAQIWAEDNLLQCACCDEWRLISNMRKTDESWYCLDCTGTEIG